MQKTGYTAYLWSCRLLYRQMPFSSPCASVTLAAGATSRQLNNAGVTSKELKGHLVVQLQLLEGKQAAIKMGLSGGEWGENILEVQKESEHPDRKQEDEPFNSAW